MLCAPTMQQRTSRVKCAAMAFQRCGGHPSALKTNRATHRMLWSCRLHTEYHLQASATSNKHKNRMQPQRLQSRYVSEDPLNFQLPRNVRSPNCCVFTGCAEAPCRPMRLPFATSHMHHSNWLARTNQRWCHPLGKNTAHFPHHLPSAGARRQARTRAIPCGYQTINLDDTIQTNKTVNSMAAKTTTHRQR